MAVTSASVVMRASFAWRPGAECRSAPRRWSVSWREGRHGIRIEAVFPGQKSVGRGNVPLLPLREETGWQIIDAIRGRVTGGARDR